MSMPKAAPNPNMPFWRRDLFWARCGLRRFAQTRGREFVEKKLGSYSSRGRPGRKAFEFTGTVALHKNRGAPCPQHRHLPSRTRCRMSMNTSPSGKAPGRRMFISV